MATAAKKTAPAAAASAKPDRKTVKAYTVASPIKTAEGVLGEGESIDLNGVDAAELLALGAITDPDAAPAED